ncbi:MAG: ABC transporter permease subunit [Planctomycetota bacterium]
MSGATTGLGIDPVMRKELFGTTRRFRTYLFRVVYVAAICVVLWLVWAEAMSHRGWYYGGAYTYSAMARVGRELFVIFAGMQISFVGLASIVFSADQLTREVRSGTLGLLVLTPLRPWQIVLGKWKACLVQVAALILCGVPILAACVYLGGARPDELLALLLLTFVCGAMGSAIGIAASSGRHAVWIAYIKAIVLLCVWGAVPFVTALASASRYRDQEAIMRAFNWCHPVPAFGFILDGSVPVETAEWACAIGTTLVLMLVILAVSAARVHPLATRTGGQGLVRSALVWMDGFFERIDPFSVRLFSGRGGVWENQPVLWKEMRTRATGTLRYATRITVLVLALTVPFLAVTMGESRDWEDWLAVILVVFWAVCVLIAAGSGASLFVKEKEEKKWDILLSTPLTCRKIVLGKIFGGLIGLAPMGICLALIWLLSSAFPSRGPWMAVLITGPFMVFYVFAYLCGAWFSVRRDTMRSAFGLTMIVLIVLLAVLPLAGALFTRRLDVPGDRTIVDFLVSVTNPFAYFEPLTRSYFYYNYYSYDDYAAYFTGFCITYAVVFVVFLAGIFAKIQQMTPRR